jgi:hypothetical protein
MIKKEFIKKNKCFNLYMIKKEFIKKNKCLNLLFFLFFLICFSSDRKIYCFGLVESLNRNLLSSNFGVLSLVFIISILSFHRKKTELFVNLNNILFKNIFDSSDLGRSRINNVSNKNKVKVSDNKIIEYPYSSFERAVNFISKFTIKKFIQKKFIVPFVVWFFFRKQINIFFSDEIFSSPFLKSIVPSSVSTNLLSIPKLFVFSTGYMLYRFRDKVNFILGIMKYLSEMIKSNLIQDLFNKTSFFDIAEKMLSAPKEFKKLEDSWNEAKKKIDEQKNKEEIVKSLEGGFLKQMEQEFENQGKADKLENEFNEIQKNNNLKKLVLADEWQEEFIKSLSFFLVSKKSNEEKMEEEFQNVNFKKNGGGDK